MLVFIFTTGHGRLYSPAIMHLDSWLNQMEQTKYLGSKISQRTVAIGTLPPLVKRHQRTFDHEMEISVPWLSGVFLKVSTQNFETVPVSYPKVQFINHLCWLLNFWNRCLPFPPRPPIYNVSFLLVQRLGENFLDLKKRKRSKVLMWHLDLVFPCYLSFLRVSLLNFCWGLRKFFRLEWTKRESSR